MINSIYRNGPRKQYHINEQSSLTGGGVRTKLREKTSTALPLDLTKIDAQIGRISGTVPYFIGNKNKDQVNEIIKYRTPVTQKTNVFGGKIEQIEF